MSLTKLRTHGWFLLPIIVGLATLPLMSGDSTAPSERAAVVDAALPDGIGGPPALGAVTPDEASDAAGVDPIPPMPATTISRDPLAGRHLGPTLDRLVAARALEGSVAGPVNVRWDVGTGLPERIRFAEGVALTRIEPVSAARELLDRVAPLYDGAVATLEHRGTTRAGSLIVVRFRQEIDGTPVVGANVVVTIHASADGRLSGRTVAGRVHAGLPDRAPPVPAPVPDPESSVPPHGLRPAADSEPSAVVWIRPDGTLVGGWRFDRWRDGYPERVVQGADGAVLHRVPLWAGGHAQAFVYPTNEGAGRRAWQPLRDLFVQTPRGTVVTDGSGRFPGRTARLAIGLRGPYERVVVNGAAEHASTTTGALELDYATADPRFDEANVFHHLVATRRWLARHADLVGDALDERGLAIVRQGDFANANQMSWPASLDGEDYDYVVRFGVHPNTLYSRFGTTVSHERAHAVLSSLGVRYEGETPMGVHEGWSDYIAAARTGLARLSSRDLSVVKIWPQDADGGEAHAVGWIFAGALWDLRSMAGAESVDRIALAAIPALAGARAPIDVRDAVLDADGRLFGGRHADAIREAFVRHGIGDDEVGSPPRLILEETWWVKPGEEVEQLVYAYDPDGDAVEIGFDRVPDFLTHAPILGTKNEGVSARMAPGAADAGWHQLVITAQDATGRTSSTLVSIVVGDHDAVAVSLAEATVRIDPGQSKIFSWDELVASSVRDRMREKKVLSNRIMDASEIDARISRDGLFVRAAPEQRGRFRVRIEHHLEGRWSPTSETIVTVEVGEGPFIELRRFGTDILYQKSELAEVALAVPADGTLELVASLAEGSEEAMLSVDLGPGVDVDDGRFSFTKLASELATKVARRFNRQAPLDLDVAPGALKLTFDGSKLDPLVRHVVTIRAQEGDRVTTREVAVVVLPKVNLVPTIEAQTTVRLIGGGGVADIVVTDPDLDELTLQWLDLPGGRVDLKILESVPGLIRARATFYGGEPFEAALFVTDAGGNATSHVFDLVGLDGKGVDRSGDRGPRSSLGLIDALRGGD